ncbi:MAG: hypothetical protein RLZZ292_3601, partial [Bacteroidota bacterium]
IIVTPSISIRNIKDLESLVNEYKKEESSITSNLVIQNKKNIFIAAPMTSITKEECEEVKKIIPNIRKQLEIDYPNYTIVSALERSQPRTSGLGNASRESFFKLRNTEFFLFIYPKAIVSSALVELGFALSQEASCVIFCKEKNDLPRLIQDYETTGVKLKIIEFDNYEHISQIVEEEGKELFD